MNKNVLTKQICILSLFIAVWCPIKIWSQTVTDDDVKSAENKAKVAEAKKREADARFPIPDSSKVVGGTKVNDGDYIETRILGYCAVKAAAHEIALRINPNKDAAANQKPDSTNNFITAYRSQSKISPVSMNSTFVVYNEADVKMLSRYTLMMNRLKILENGYRSITGEKKNLGIDRSFPIPLVANTALNYLSLLKTDIEISGKEFDVNEKELVAELFSQLKANNNNFNLYYPKTVPLSLINCTESKFEKCSPLFGRIIDLSQAFEDAKKLGENIPDDSKVLRKNLNTIFELTMIELGLVKKDDPPKPEAGNPNPSTTPEKTSTQTTTVNVIVGDKKEEDKKDNAAAGGGDKSFFSYLQAENLYNLMQSPDSYWIDMQVVKAGGNMRIKSNIITNFMIGSRTNFSGGAIVHFNVFNVNGKSMISGLIPSYEKYRKSSRIDETCR